MYGNLAIFKQAVSVYKDSTYTGSFIAFFFPFDTSFEPDKNISQSVRDI